MALNWSEDLAIVRDAWLTSCAIVTNIDDINVYYFFVR